MKKYKHPTGWDRREMRKLLTSLFCGKGRRTIMTAKALYLNGNPTCCPFRKK